MRFFGKIQIRILIIQKTDFAFLYLSPKMDYSGISDLKNPLSEGIHQIKSKSGILGFMICVFLWRTDRGKTTFGKRSSCESLPYSRQFVLSAG